MLKRKARSTLCVLTSLILSTFLISSCASVKPLQIATVPVQRIPLELPGVDPLVLEAIEWHIVTEENFKQVMADFEKKGYDTIVFGLTDKGYEILSINMLKIQQLVRQQKAKIKAYEEYYIEQNSALDNMQVEQDEKMKEMETKNKNTRTWADRIFKNPFGSDK